MANNEEGSPEGWGSAQSETGERRADYWVNVLKTQGYGCVDGKFHPKWVVNGKPISTELSELAVSYFNRALKEGRDPNMDFASIFPFGQSNIKESIQYIPAAIVRAVSGSSGRDYVVEEIANAANYLARSRPLDRVANKNLFDRATLPDDLSSGLYLMWQSKDHTPDSRGHHVGLGFVFLLPTPFLDKLFTEVGVNPDLIEEVFQGVYPGLTGDTAVKRVKVGRLRIIDIPDNNIARDYHAFKRLLNSPLALSFSHPAGEV